MNFYIGSAFRFHGVKLWISTGVSMVIISLEANLSFLH